jgi:hypothetical protein
LGPIVRAAVLALTGLLSLTNFTSWPAGSSIPFSSAHSSWRRSSSPSRSSTFASYRVAGYGSAAHAEAMHQFWHFPARYRLPEMRKATVPQKHYGCLAPRTAVEAAMDPAKVAQMAEALNRLAAADALSLLVACILTVLDEARSLVLQTDRSASMRLSSDCWRSSSLGDIATRADIPEGRCLTFHLEPVDSRLWRFGYFQHACRLLLHLGVSCRAISRRLRCRANILCGEMIEWVVASPRTSPEIA